MSNFRRWMVRSLVALMVGIPLTVVSLYVVNPFGAQSKDPRQRIVGYAPYRIVSESMLPTLRPGQIVIMRAGYYRKHPVLRGDVVVYLNPENRDPWIHRIVGMPGETIAIVDGELKVNGRLLLEHYVEPAYTTSDYSWEMPMVRIPEGHYFLLGDNRDNSMDSRMLGAIPLADLNGKVTKVLK
ncbi:signal peptidase I [Pseudoxanthomonas helianthi]|uniref:Signal peptidase I n=1 Tax=Pseudoxanthomonas helianthi TaxID=1453541 RepID=A0A940X476_9GAMM|nr:signal peptidase I [Pseudoxanthomonas helianthi]MBP3984907.1 signal peptidase I [Pseudoxanthomonas helianthi]